MKTLLNLGNGAVTVTEEQLVVTLAINEQASIGGGQAAGIVKVAGAGSTVLNGPLAIQLAFALINPHVPAFALPIATALENILLKAVTAIA
jgi:hypothetical protein